MHYFQNQSNSSLFQLTTLEICLFPYELENDLLSTTLTNLQHQLYMSHFKYCNNHCLVTLLLTVLSCTVFPNHGGYMMSQIALEFKSPIAKLLVSARRGRENWNRSACKRSNHSRRSRRISPTQGKVGIDGGTKQANSGNKSSHFKKKSSNLKWSRARSP